MRTLCCDVGSTSVRVAIFEYPHRNELNPIPLAVATGPLNIYNPRTDFYEQKSKEIWSTFCTAASECLKQLKSKYNLEEQTPINSIGFTSTCSLVIVEEGTTLDECDVIMWMDHRAKLEAELINQSKNSVLDRFGGVCSPEFSLAKLVWIHNNQRNRFDNAKAFMELPDWLSYRCSQLFNQSPEKFPRSLCSVGCKWGYDANENKWCQDLFKHLGMNFESFKQKIGNHIIKPGLPIGHLSVNVAQEIGIELKDDKIVNSILIASSLIDAHAGALSMLIFSKSIKTEDPYENVLCMISGTSTCHMILNNSLTPTKGVWGPYLDAIIPGYYLREAGQSATGKLIEHIISYQFKTETFNFKNTIKELNKQLSENNFIYQTSLIINPTFHGNRSPIANPRLKGAIYGLTLDEHSLMDIYVATIEAIAYETKFIVEEIEKNSKPIQKIIVSGGLTKNDFYLQIHSDVLGRELFIYNAGEADHMLTGASIIAFTATCNNQANDSNDMIAIFERIHTNKTKTRIIQPKRENFNYHEKKYKCYRKLVDCCLQIEDIMSN